MPVIQTRGNGSGTGEGFSVLPTDTYHMKIIEAKIEENQYAEPRKDGTKPDQLVITWEIVRLTDEQVEDGVREDARVFQRVNPYYGTIRDGGDSRFKELIDKLQKQGFLPNFDPDEFDTDDLIDLEQRVTVEEYIKTMGPNAGKPGNRIAAILPIRKPKTQPQPETAAPAQRPAQRNKPQPIAAGVEDDSDIPF